jgi:hypothetical protein
MGLKLYANGEVGLALVLCGTDQAAPAAEPQQSNKLRRPKGII